MAIEAMAFAIFPVERLHEHKSSCNIKDIALSSVIYKKFEENKCSDLTEKMGILILPSSHSSELETQSSLVC